MRGMGSKTRTRAREQLTDNLERLKTRGKAQEGSIVSKYT
jgi:hypothetical protein